MSVHKYTSYLYGIKITEKNMLSEPLIRYDPITGEQKTIKQWKYWNVFDGTDIKVPDSDDSDYWVDFEILSNNFIGSEAALMFGVRISEIDEDEIYVIDSVSNDNAKAAFIELVAEHFNDEDATTLRNLANFVIFTYYN